MIRLANPNVLFILIPIFLLFILYRLYFYKSNRYVYPLSSFLKKKGFVGGSFIKRIFFLLRLISLLILILLIAKPQLVDLKSKVNLEGRDIILSIDVSASMSSVDDPVDPRNRIDIAKQEAIDFIDKRDSDQMGLVIFGNTVVTRCPLTFDKDILKEIVNDLNIGVIDPDGTLLSLGLMSGINRLKSSTAKTKIIILLTDGYSSDRDVPYELPLDLAKKLKIKIYTIGICDEDNYLGSFNAAMGYGVNKKFLQMISDETGGQFFMAKNSKDMKKIYGQIDKLETSKFETEIYNKYFDIFIPFLWIVFILLFIEFLLKTFIWFSI